MQYEIEYRTIWEVGQRIDGAGKPHQEDSIFPAAGHISSECRFFVLCDGMGGHESGEVASSTVCRAMSQIISPLSSTDGFRFSDNDLQSALSAAYDELDKLDEHPTERKRMGTTMTVLALHDDGATIAHIGDSRVYHIRPVYNGRKTKILFRTKDHSLVNELISIGEIKPKEAKTHPRCNVITRAMQPHQDSQALADVRHIPDVRPGDYFYLCSDGMLEQMDDKELSSVFSTEDICEIQKKLIDATCDNRDNHSAFIVRILKVDNISIAEYKRHKRKYLFAIITIIIFILVISLIVLSVHNIISR